MNFTYIILVVIINFLLILVIMTREVVKNVLAGHGLKWKMFVRWMEKQTMRKGDKANYKVHYVTTYILQEQKL